MSRAQYLVCPSCEHCERVASGSDDGSAADPTDGTVCPACGSGRAYRAQNPALHAETEAYVKFDAGSAGE